MKIQISFCSLEKKIKYEKFRSDFELEKIISENTYQFFQFRKFRFEKFRLVFSLSLIKESQ